MLEGGNKKNKENEEENIIGNGKGRMKEVIKVERKTRKRRSARQKDKERTEREIEKKMELRRKNKNAEGIRKEDRN